MNYSLRDIMVCVRSGVVTFRYTADNIELLLIQRGDTISHTKGLIGDKETLAETALRDLLSETGLNLLVVSLEPVFEGMYSFEKDDKIIEEKICYFAGIADPRQSVTLKDDQVEYLWIDHLGGRNVITKDLDIDAYESARSWLYENDEAALFLANYLEKLQK